MIPEPELTMAERLGFSRAWYATRARGWLDTASVSRKAGMLGSAALHLRFAGECRRDALALPARQAVAS